MLIWILVRIDIIIFIYTYCFGRLKTIKRLSLICSFHFTKRCVSISILLIICCSLPLSPSPFPSLSLSIPLFIPLSLSLLWQIYGHFYLDACENVRWTVFNIGFFVSVFFIIGAIIGF